MKIQVYVKFLQSEKNIDPRATDAVFFPWCSAPRNFFKNRTLTPHIDPIV